MTANVTANVITFAGVSVNEDGSVNAVAIKCECKCECVACDERLCPELPLMLP